MVSFQVQDMTCAHCAGRITKAVQAADKGARVDIDLVQRRVAIEAAQATAEQLQAAIAGAGYSPTPIAP